jgi:hypothetical protein
VGLRRPNRDAVTADQPCAPESAGRQLDGGECPERCRNAPCADLFHNLQDATVAGDEEDVDRKPHETGVYRATRRQDERVAFRKPVAAEQASAPRSGIDGGFEDRRDN